jgi:TRAP-type C4-dicarboxylate transport system substrate-binding protein
MKKLTFLVIALLLAVAMVLPACAAKPTQVFKWRAWSYESIGEPGYTYVAKIADAVTKASGGRLTITPYAGETLGYVQSDILKVMKQDGIEMAHICAGQAAGDAPLVGVTSLPFLAPDPNTIKKILDALTPMYNDDILPPFHAMRIAAWSASPAVLSCNRQVDTVDKWKGLKIRTYSAGLTKIIELLGATPVSLPYSEVYSATSTGIVDGHLWSPRGTYDGKLYEILKSANLWYPLFADDVLLVNTTAFNKLPEDLQDLVIKTTNDLNATVWQDAFGNIDEDLQKLKDNGMTLVQVSDAERAKAAQLTQPVYEDFLKTAGPDALKWLNIALAAAGKPAYK